MKFWERAGIAIMSVWGLLATYHIVRRMMDAHNWQGLTPGDQATWVGSIGTWVGGIGTVIAIFASLHLYKRQRAQQTQQALDDRLIYNIQVLDSIEGMIMHAMGVINLYVEAIERGESPEDVASQLEWLKEMRQHLFRFVEPGTPGWLTHALTFCMRYITEAIPQIQLQATPTRVEKLRELFSKMKEEHLRILGRLNMLRDEGTRRGVNWN